jgi:hypothetical protein
MEQELELIDSQTDDSSIESTDQYELEEVAEEDVSAIKAEKERLAQENRKQKKEDKKEEAPLGYSLQDIRSLQGVHDQDVDEVTDFAKYKGISISEAVKHPIMATILREKEEQRKTALVTNTGPAKRGSSMQTDEQLVANMLQGRLPESDDEIRRLAEARMAMKKAKKL